MPDDQQVSLYILFKEDAPPPAESLAERRAQQDRIESFALAFRGLLEEARIELPRDSYTFVDAPTVQFYKGTERVDSPPPRVQVINVVSPDAEAARGFINATATLLTGDNPLVSIGVNPVISAGAVGMPAASEGAIFGTTSDALALIRADTLAALAGEPVNVVIIDTGFDMNCLPPSAQFGGGWQPVPTSGTLPVPNPPGMTTGPDGLHAQMIVDAVLAVAPNARFFDVPLIPPPKLYDVPAFLHIAQATFEKILTFIPDSGKHFDGPWVIVNAWSVYDRRSEGAELGGYTENLGSGGVRPHPFIGAVEALAALKADLIFAAGNCGEFCPDNRCGPNDYGPRRSIWGANAHPAVLTVGAVQVDGTWLGYSSEGSGPTPHLDPFKPDLCAPSQFAGALGLFPQSTGTSAACGIAAGVVTALRQRWDQSTVSPAHLNFVLNVTARQTMGGGWNRFLGNGILDAGAALDLLQAVFPR